MAYEGEQFLWSYDSEGTAGTTLPEQYEIVKKGTGNNQVIQATVDTGFGIIVNKPTAAGDQADVVVLGITKVKAGAAIATGVRFTADAAGKAVAANLAAEEVVGITIGGAGAADELVTVLVCPSIY
jgi:hypothetical protein